MKRYDSTTSGRRQQNLTLAPRRPPGCHSSAEPPCVSRAFAEVGLLNFDAPGARSTSFARFEVLPVSPVDRASPLVVALGSGTPVVLYGNQLGGLVQETSDAVCRFTMVYATPRFRDAAVWVLDAQRVACFPPPMDIADGDSATANVTLHLHGCSKCRSAVRLRSRPMRRSLREVCVCGRRMQLRLGDLTRWSQES